MLSIQTAHIYKAHNLTVVYNATGAGGFKKIQVGYYSLCAFFN